jgi:hypothetical protein
MYTYKYCTLSETTITLPNLKYIAPNRVHALLPIAKNSTGTSLLLYKMYDVTRIKRQNDISQYKLFLQNLKHLNIYKHKVK